MDGPDLAFLERLAPMFRRLRAYFRLRVEGLDHVPQGPALLVANHTGWLGFDFALTALSVYDGHDRFVRGMVHEAWFRTQATSEFAKKCGLIPVSKESMRERLDAGDLVMVFPEGEKGAFRPGSDYQLEEFARGFVRVAMETGVPVIPVAILGGEEANPVGRRIDSYEELLNLSLPIPKNILPKPVKWRIKFLEPLDLSRYPPEMAGDRDLVHGIARDVQERVQHALGVMKVERGHPYL